MEEKIDSLDLSILCLLQSDCRLSISEIARVLKKPRTTIASRLSRLKSLGVIRSYRAILDPKKLGFLLTAFIFITAKRGVEGAGNQIALARRILESCSKNEGLWVEEISIITGRYDLMLKLRVKSLNYLTHFLINLLPRFGDVERSETFIVLHTIDELRPAPI